MALARAIVPRPRVLLLDEPLSALDAKLRREMQVELKRLQRRIGVTTILVTHDQEEALAMSDRVAVMHAGRIEQLGTGEDVYNRPRSAFVAEFLGESNLVEASVVSAGGDEVGLRSPEGWMLNVRRPPARAIAVGAAHTVSIRPEALRVSHGAPPTNAIRARVLEKTFLGSAVRIVMETESKRRLTALSPDPRTADAEPGSLVFCGFDPGAAFLLD